MTVGNTTGTNREHRKEAFAIGALEEQMPNAATATTGAATLSQGAGLVTSESITTAAGSTYTLTLTNSFIDVNTLVFANVKLGTATTGQPCIATCTALAGSCKIVVQNIAASAAFNGNIVIGFFIVRKAAPAL